MDSLQPLGERNVGALEDGSRPHRKLLATAVALVETETLPV